jgi:glycosyltransferase involved in cell wall biosynthesis
MKLSIIVPVFNEESTILAVVAKIKSVSLGADLVKEIIIVDDGSTDGTREALRQINDPAVKIFLKDKNEGKGSALIRGFQEATGDIVLIQDADLEYSPEEYPRLVEPIIEGRADVVLGSRFMGSGAKRVLFYWHYFGNRLLTTFSNMLTNLDLTDMETCYKVFRREVVDSFKDKLKSKRFGIEPELVARMARGKWRIYEIGVAYSGRTYEEGKKVSWRDGLAAFWHIIRFNIFPINKR